MTIPSLNETLLCCPSHGRILWQDPTNGGPPQVALLSLHGYAQLADDMVESLAPLRMQPTLALAHLQARHLFYRRRRSGDIGASWMTSHLRDPTIADNDAYIATALAAMQEKWPSTPIFILGFSQGASQAWRSAYDLRKTISGIISIGGDIPPEATGWQTQEIPAALILRGTDDHIYSPQHFENDCQKAKGLSLAVRAQSVAETAHVINATCCQIIGDWITTILN